MRILFVEDDTEMRDVYVETFKQPEFEVITAANGIEALKVLQGSNTVDVLVSDNAMPQMDGITLLKNVHRLYPHLKVVIVTGYGNWPDYVGAFNLGAWKFVDKPVKMTELKKMILTLPARAGNV